MCKYTCDNSKTDDKPQFHKSVNTKKPFVEKFSTVAILTMIIIIGNNLAGTFFLPRSLSNLFPSYFCNVLGYAAFAQLAAACTVVALVGSRLPVFWRRADAEQRSHAPTRAAAIGMGVTLKIAAEEPLLSVTFSPATNFWGNKRQTFDNCEDF